MDSTPDGVVVRSVLRALSGKDKGPSALTRLLGKLCLPWVALACLLDRLHPGSAPLLQLYSKEVTDNALSDKARDGSGIIRAMQSAWGMSMIPGHAQIVEELQDISSY